MNLGPRKITDITPIQKMPLMKDIKGNTVEDKMKDVKFNPLVIKELDLIKADLKKQELRNK